MKAGALLIALAATAAASDQGEHRSSVDRLVSLVVDRIAASRAEGPVALWVTAASPELAARVTALGTAELSRRGLGGVAVDGKDPKGAEARARELSARSLVRLAVGLDKGALTARGELFGLWVNFWSGQSPTRSVAPTTTIDASTLADAYALAILAPAAQLSGPTRLALVPSLLGRFTSAVAAVAAGDLDGDGVDEAIAVTDDAVVVLNASGRVLARREHKALAPAAARVRDPIARAAVISGQVAYFHAGHARGEILAYAMGELRAVHELELAPLSGGAWGRWVPGQNALTYDAHPTHPIHALATFERSGRVDVVIMMPGGVAAWTRGGSSRADVIPNVGASALCDLDGDGAPELVTSSSAVQPDKDELVVYPDAPWGSAPTWQASVGAGRVVELAAARMSKGREQQLLVAVWLPNGTSELHLYRRVAP